jgi:hypothetical protein
MSDLRRPRPLGQATAPLGAPAGSARPLDWGDPAAVAAWLRDVHTQARDAVAAGDDATRPPGRRELGRRAARRIIREASRKLADLFLVTGLDPAEPPAPGAP